MTDLLQLIQKLSLSTGGNLDKQFTERFADVTTYLTALTESRVLVAYSGTFETTASSVDVLRNLIRLGAKTATYTIAMSAANSSEYDELVADLKLLIPQFESVGTEFELEGCKVTVIQLDSALGAADFGITGGFDDTGGKPPLDNLNVKYFLQLQPYGAAAGKNVVYVRTDNVETQFDLDANWPDALIAKRAYHRPTPVVSESDWTALEAGDYKVQASICKYLFEQAESNKINLAAATGAAAKGSPTATLYNLTSGILAAQTAGYAGANIASVIVCASDVRTPEWSALLDYLTYDPKSRTAPAASPDFVSWHKTNNVATRVTTAGSPGSVPSLDAVQTAVGELQNNQVLIVDLGVIPAVLSDKLFGDSKLPSVAESLIDGELLLNLGKPYFKLTATSESSDFAYPTLPLESVVGASSNAGDASDRAFNGILFSTPSKWYSGKASYPPTQLPPMFAASFDPTTALGAYFAEIGTYYQGTDDESADEHDKLARGLDLLVNIIIPGTQPNNPDLLQKLYDALVAGTDPETKNIFLMKVFATGAFGPTFADFWAPVLDDAGKNFLLTNSDPQIDGDKTKVTLADTGTTALGIGNTTLSFEFTATGNIINSKVVGTLQDASWAPPGAQWLSFSKFGLGVSLNVFASVPVTAYVSVTVTAGTTMEMLFTIPTDTGKVQLQVTFTDKRPSIDTIFQLVGGINLQAILPSQIALLTSIGVNDLQFRYNYGATPQSLEYFAIELGTPPASTWDLVPGVTVKGLGFQALVDNPGNTKTRKAKYNINGQFGIAGGDGYIDASVPELRVTGGLTDDSPPVTLFNLIKTFLGQTFANAVPSAVANTSITVLTFSVDKSLGTYSFTTRVEANWTIPGPFTFIVQSLGFAITATSQEIDPNTSDGANDPADTTTTTKIDGNFDGNISVPIKGNPPIALSVIAAYNTDTLWTFTGKQVGSAISIGSLVDSLFGWQLTQFGQYNVQDLAIVIATKDNSWSFSGAVTDWAIPFLGLTIKKATALVGYKAASATTSTTSLALLRGTRIALADDGGCAGAGTFGRFETELVWSGMNVTLRVYYNYCPEIQEFGIVWNKLEGNVKGPINPEGDWQAKLTYDGTMGDIISDMISWATGARFTLDPPWNVIDSINLSNLALIYTFNSTDKTRNKVSFEVTIGPINLGFARIDSIGIDYQSSGEKKGVNVALKGSFPWNIGDGATGDTNELGWDASKPGSAPAPSGNGNKYLDLRLLAMGQHVTAPCFPSVTTVQEAIDCMRTMPPTEPGQVPAIAFDARSNWLIGTDFGILKLGDDSGGDKALMVRPPTVLATEDSAPGYFINLQIVFNDPYLYGLHIKLDGAPAKIFKGLDFQIMYRQISDSVGVYQAEITLPDAMRNLSIGAYTIILPVFAVAVYTNGDFQIDVGFPWNEDFSRSLTVEGIIPPGIPVLGSAGFYFGKLSSATTNKVPQITNGTFNPVIVFGFGMQIGFGKSIQYGILSAGFSVTVVGIIEGVIAKFNPYPGQITDGSGDNQVQGAYYFWLRGTVGIIGKVFGTVDFAIIKANVNVVVKLLLQLTYESYVSITITVIASVEVSVDLKINLGLFSITISFSFSMRLKETFTIENSGTPPWKLKEAPQTLLKAQSRLRAFTDRAFAARGSMLAAAASVNWGNLTNPNPATKRCLSGWFAPALTMARDEWTSSAALDSQVPCLVSVITIDTVPPDGPSTLTPCDANDPDTSFEKIAKMVLRWAIAATAGKTQTPEQVDASIVTADALTVLLETVLVSDNTNPTPIPADAVDAFLSAFFLLTAKLPPDSAGSSQAAYFPMASKLSFKVPAYGGNPALDYTFGGFNSISNTALGELRDYFDQLAVQVQQEMDAGQPQAAFAAATTSLSMGAWIVSDYFLLVARQMVQAAQDALRDFQYLITPGQTPSMIVSWVNTTGQLTGTDGEYALFDLFDANQSHLLTTPPRTLTVGVIWPVQGTQSFANIGEMTSLQPDSIALLNAAATILAVNAVVTYPGQPPYTIVANDTLITVAAHFGPGVTVAGVVTKTDVLTQNGLLTMGAGVMLPYVTQQTPASGTFTTVAQAAPWSSSFTPTQLATQSAGASILATGAKIVYDTAKDPYTVLASQCLGDVANALNLPLSDLLSKSDVLTNQSLLIPVAVLNVPQFTAAAQAGDTLQSYAARYATTLQVLAPAEPAAQPNGNITDLWATVDAGNKTTPFIDIPHLKQFQVGELISESQRSGAIQHLSGMVSRYYFHGLRIPTVNPANNNPWITPNALGMWVKSVNNTLTLPSMAGLFALTGQQVPVSLIGTDAFTATLDRSSGPDWIAFKDSSGTATNTLTISIASGSVYANRISALKTYASSNRLPVDLLALGAQGTSESELVTYSFNSSLVWQSAGTVTLPYGSSTGGAQSLKLWKLPDSLINLPDPETRAVDPRFAVKVARYDEATGAMIEEEITSHGWASVVSFTVKRTPVVSDSAAAPDTYEVGGADGNSILLLERIVGQLGTNDSAIDQIILGYEPDQTGSATEGVQTDLLAALTFGIAQVNLSTVTRPPTSALALLAAEPVSIGLLNTKTEFIRLLWEASITNAGGFYLYYYDSDGNRGLPDRIFNDRGEATLSLIVVYAAALDNQVADFMNMVATGEAIAATSSTVFAQADPIPMQFTPQPGYSLSSIAYAYYTDLGDLAGANASLALATGLPLALAEGTYQAPPGGIALQAVATRFGTTVAAIQNANSAQWGGNLPDPLPFPTVIWLPKMTLTTGTSPHTASLSDLSVWYGENLVTLAVDNAGVQNPFGTTANVNVPGGPATRSSTVPAGVQPVVAQRPVPPAIPPDSDPNWARIFLLNNFNLLGYQVYANKFFKASLTGLPAGPTLTKANAVAAPKNMSRVRAVPQSDPGDLWTYSQSVPYPQFSLTQPSPSSGTLPPAADSPYLGIGALLQVDFAWQDYFGNGLITTLSNPQAGDAGPYNDPVVLTGYTDSLVGLSQWPSMASSWQIKPPSGVPLLELLLTFDNTRYQGLIAASAATSAPTTITASFTQPVDTIPASDATKYNVAGGTSVIAVKSAVPAAGGLSVTLTIDTPMTENVKYAVSVTNIKRQGDDVTFTGNASFIFGGTEADSTSSLRQSSSSDLSVYEQLYYQVNDPNGTAFAIDTSVLQSPGTIALTTAQVQPLLAWLFTGSGSTIYGYIQDRAAGNTTVAGPASSLALDIPLAGLPLNSSEIYRLTCGFTIKRTGGVVAGDLSAEDGMRTSRTEVAPLIDAAGGNTAMTLDTFATNFEGALTVAGQYAMKVATGVDREEVSTARSGSAVWAVRLGLVPANGISYSINDPGNPALFAPAPISNELQTRNQVPIYDYKTGTGIDFSTPSSLQTFVNIDMDVWGRQLFAAMDDLLTPSYTAAIQIVSKEKDIDYLGGDEQLLDQKKYLATMAKGWMIAVFDGETTDDQYAQETFYQQLLSALSNAYTTRAAIGFDATVNADVSTPPPRLYGNVTINSISTGQAAGDEQASEITLTSPKIDLATSAAAPLTFLLIAPETVRGASGEVVSTITLDLTYGGTNIEHQIETPAGIQGYQASSWLTFVLSADAQLSKALGQFPVPMLLRSYPATPTMPNQTGEPTYPGSTDLASLRKWNYDFTYSLPFHYPQDRIYGTVEFNIQQAALFLASFLDQFPQLAEFVTVYPQVLTDLNGILATIDATIDPSKPDDQKKIDDSAIALQSVVGMLSRITGNGSTAALAVSKPPRALAGDPSLTYSFTIDEGEVSIGSTPAALLVSIAGTPPAGIGTPIVYVDAAGYMPVPYTQGDLCTKAGLFCYVYRKNGTTDQYLRAVDGQAIGDRNVVLPDLDIFQRQNAHATVYLKRNDFEVTTAGGSQQIAQPFIYRTPDVTFSNALTPTLNAREPLPIQNIGGTGVSRSLRAALGAVFDALLADNTQPVIIAQVAVEYAFNINAVLAAVSLPVLMQPPLQIVVRTGGTGDESLDTMLDNWTTAITNWFNTNAPNGTSGALSFDLTILSSLTVPSMPVLWLHDLELPLSFIQPPMKTS